MIRSVSITLRPDDDKSTDYLSELVDFLLKSNIQVQLQDCNILNTEKFSEMIPDEETFINNAELVIVIGGDGTFLRTARLFADTGTPIFGINRGRLGFLTEFSPNESIEHLKKVIRGDYTTASRSMLEARITRNNREIHKIFFLNDAVISRGAFSRPINIELHLDNIFLNRYAGDGLIIATSTGSTAYSLSAGGPIIIPSTENLYIVNPICPHTLAMRPMIVSSEINLKVRIVSPFENLLLTIDGQEAIPIEGEDEINIRGSKKKVSLITHPEKSFYAILRQKLGWGSPEHNGH